jgi:dinuclear metal center YbgI/SA1388 family protein
MKTKDYARYLESIASPHLQESYDNSGLLVGDPEQEVTEALCCLDVTENIIAEALEKNCQLVIAHHPIIFSGLRSLTGKNHVERTVLAAIKAGIGIYALHTNLDNVLYRGVNEKIGQVLGLQDLRILRPKSNATTRAQAVVKASAKAWKEKLNSFSIAHFNQWEESQGHLHIGFDFPSYLQSALEALWSEEEDLIDFAFSPSFRTHGNIGSGAIGILNPSMPMTAFFERVKSRLQVSFIKHTEIHKPDVTKVALCGGSGSFLLKDAMAQGADIFLTADYKYHQFFEAEGKITIVDAGHYETEQYTKDLLVELLENGGFKARSTTLNTNPVRHF